MTAPRLRALITGATGTVGSALFARTRAAGGEAIPWDRRRAAPGDAEAARAMVEETAPDAIFHLALPSQPTGAPDEGVLVNERWTADLARLADERGIPFVFTSTVMVFSNRARGPFTPDFAPDETEGYGAFKLQGEAAARSAGDQTRIARLGWQIGDAPGSNNMVHHFTEQQRDTGRVSVSCLFLPATSFLPDTADALLRIAQLPPDTWHIDSNRGWNLFEIATALNALHGSPWNVVETEDFEQNQQMPDERLEVTPLSKRLEFR